MEASAPPIRTTASNELNLTCPVTRLIYSYQNTKRIGTRKMLVGWIRIAAHNDNIAATLLPARQAQRNIISARGVWLAPQPKREYIIIIGVVAESSAKIKAGRSPIVLRS